MKRLLLALLTVGCLNGPAPAAERYYVVLFGSQPAAPEARFCHSFGAFVKVADDGKTTTHFAISWLPATKNIRLLAPPEPGRNFTLSETLAFTAEQNVAVTYWGPFEIKKELYDHAVAQSDRLKRGEFTYKAVNPRLRGSVVNCIQALSDVVPGDVFATGTARGNAATSLIVQHYRPFLIEPAQVHAKTLDQLGLSEAERRALNPATPNASATPSK